MNLAAEAYASPMGPLLLIASEGGLLRIALPAENPAAVLEDAAARLDADVVDAPPLVAAARCELDEYFAGTRTRFTLAVDWSLARAPFRRRVLEEMAAIPYGDTISYGELAARAGNPQAHRAAGHACATNPIPIVFPCHRVVRSDGHLNWYSGGLHYKRFLLRLEGVWPVDDRVRAAPGRPAAAT